MKKRWTIGGIIAAFTLLVGMWLLILPSREQTSINVKVEYRGSTNVVDGTAWSHFRLVNGYSQPIIFRVGRLQHVRNDKGVDSSPAFLPVEQSIGPDGTTFIQVGSPGAGNRWRLPVHVRTSMPQPHNRCRGAVNDPCYVPDMRSERCFRKTFPNSYSPI